MTTTLLMTLITTGLGLSTLAAVMFQMITGRAASLAFEDGDNAVVPLAITFRLMAGPGILLFGYVSALSRGKADALNFAGAAVGLVWASAYGLGLGIIT